MAEELISGTSYIRRLTPALEQRIERNPSLNIDTFIIPSPYVSDVDLEKDYEHSYVWDEEGELLGYCLVYANPQGSKFHVYKLVTSPFGRGKGIGSAFLFRLVHEVPPAAVVYVYVWEKQTETMLFFSNKGFATEGRIVYRNLVYDRLASRAGELKPTHEEGARARGAAEDLGRTRHDARKTLRLLQDMVDNLSVDNCNRIIEDINRESTALMNLLNSYRDTVEYFHDVDLKELVFERIIPYIELSHVSCEVQLSIGPRIGAAYAHYLDVGRALVNMVSNSLDAIEEAGRPGVIKLSLQERDSMVELILEDNGVGMEAERLVRGADGLPAFVGRSSKAHRVGEGIGTRQVFSTFGPENIDVRSERGSFTRWTVRFPKRSRRDDSALRSLEERYRGFRELTEFPDLAVEKNRARVASFVWQTTSLEILCWDLIVPFGLHNNIREIYRGLLAYWHTAGGPDGGYELLQVDLQGCRVEPADVREWLVDAARMYKRNAGDIARYVSYPEFAGHIFRSYGQSVGKTVVFTLDPDNGRFLAADRKLAEHVDFAPYLKRRREDLIRGELTGDVKNPETPLRLGVWSIAGEADAISRLAFLRRGCAKLLEMGIAPEKQIAFYQTTYRSGPVELNIYVTPTLGEVAGCADQDLAKYLAPADEEEFFSGTAD